MVNTHPTHYTRGNIEVWDFVRDQELNYHRGNAIKYICRAGHKSPDTEIEDLQKAIHYLENERAYLLSQQPFGTGNRVPYSVFRDELEGEPDYATGFDR